MTARCSLALALLVAVAAAGCGPSVAERRRRTVCDLAERGRRVDLLPAAPDGLAARVVAANGARRRALASKVRTAAEDGGLERVRVTEPRPRLAVIIDDLGLHPGQLRRFWRLGVPLTWALLPNAPHTPRYARWLRERGASMLVHLPMEPRDPSLMTMPGFLRTRQTPTERTQLLRRALRRLPGAIGVSNHMGSRLTSDVDAMRRLVSALPEGTVVLDSRTTPASHLANAARRHELPTAERDVFLDHDRDLAAIRRQLHEALRRARRHGHAVAIGHPYPETARALRRFLREHGREVHLVPVERVAEPRRAPPWMAACGDPAGKPL